MKTESSTTRPVATLTNNLNEAQRLWFSLSLSVPPGIETTVDFNFVSSWNHECCSRQIDTFEKTCHSRLLNAHKTVSYQSVDAAVRLSLAGNVLSSSLSVSQHNHRSLNNKFNRTVFNEIIMENWVVTLGL